MKLKVFLSKTFFAIFAVMLLLTLSPFAGSAAAAQQGDVEISGLVLDDVNEPVIGASVIIKENKTVGVMTDLDGKFKINAKIGNTLVVSFIGFATQEIKINSAKPVEVFLEQSVNELEELVVVAYGSVKRVNLTGSVTAVRAKDMQTTVSSDAVNTLTGRAPGVRVTQYSSEPGSFDTSIDIRGFGDPLFIIDGVERSKGEFSRLSPSEIESVSVLKDGSAAIYGVKAANGVVLVSTKKGNNSKPVVSYSVRVGMQAITSFMEGASAYDYANMYNEKRILGALRSHSYLKDPALIQSQLKYSPEMLEKFRSGEFQTFNPFDEIFDKTAFQHQHNISVRGGSDRVKYFLSAGYFKDHGLFSSHDLNSDKYNLRLNMDNQIAKGLVFSLNLGYINTIKKGLYNSNFDIFKGAIKRPPTEPLYLDAEKKYPAVSENGDLNPAAIIDRDKAGYNDNDERFFQSTFALKWNLPWVKGLSAQVRYSYDYMHFTNQKYRKPYDLFSYDAATETYIPTTYAGPAKYEEILRRQIRKNFRAQIDYKGSFNGHNVSALLLYEQRSTSDRHTNASTDIALSGIPELAPGIKESNKVGSSYLETANRSLVVRATYDYKSRYMIDFSGRYDGSSKFPKGKRWAFFPSVSAGWRISEEKFVKDNIDWMNNLKLRASWGRLGDDRASAFQYITGFDYPSKNGWQFGDSWTTGLGLRDIANEELTWYTSDTFNVGVDLDFFDSKLTFAADYFVRDRQGLLAYQNVTLPGYFGAKLPQVNLDGDRTAGYELVLGHKNSVNGFTYKIEANMSYTRVKRMYVEETPARDSRGHWRDGKSYRYGDLVWGYKTDGFYESFEQIEQAPVYHQKSTLLPGDVKVVDVNKDGYIDTRDMTVIGIGGGKPLYYFGLNFDFEYKGFSFSMLWQGAAKNTIRYADAPLQEPFGWGFANFDKNMTDRWYCHDLTRPYDTASWTPGSHPNTDAFGTDYYRKSDMSYFDATYLRLKNIEIGYSLPRKVLKNSGVSNCRFYLNAFNLFTISNAHNYLDPEVNAGRNYSYSYPVTRNFNIGFDITF